MEQVRSVDPDTSRADPLPRGPKQRSLWSVVAMLAAVVVALSVALAVVRAQDGRPRAEVGDLFDFPFQEEPLPHRGQVLLPWARTEVGASGPRQELPDLLGAEPTVGPPDGGSFVRVELEVEEDYAIVSAAAGTSYAQEAEVVLRADGRDYPLSGPGGLVLDPDTPLARTESVWVAVEGEPSDLEVHVTVDGVTQVVDAADGSVDAGRAADLADLPSPEELRAPDAPPCGTPRRLDDTGLTVSYRPMLECRVLFTLRTPYVDGIGWAPSGGEFLVVHIDGPTWVSLRTGPKDDATYWDTRIRFSARLGGTDPVAPEIDANSLIQGRSLLLDPDNPGQVVFEVGEGEPAGDLTLDLVADARLGEPFVTERQQMRVRWTIPGGELG